MVDPMVFKESLEILNEYCVFPSVGQQFTTKLLIKLHVILICAFGPSIIGNILYLWRVMTVDNVSSQSIIETLRLNFQVVSAGLTGFSALYRGNDILDFFNHLAVHKYSKIEKLDEVHKKLDNLTKYMYRFFQVMCIGVIVLNFWKNSFCEARYTYNDDRYICGMVSPFWTPFHLNIFFKFWIFFSASLSLIIYFPMASLGFSFVFGVSYLIVLRMKHMENMLKKVSFQGSQEDLKNQLKYLIKYHSEIWRLVIKMNNSFGKCHSFQYFLISGLIAIIEFELLMSYNIFMGSTQLLCLIIGEFMLCSAGQIIENECEELTNSLYSTPWYRLPASLRSVFRIFLAKSQVPLHADAKPLFHLNYMFLTKVLRFSYSLLMFLQKTSSS